MDRADVALAVMAKWPSPGEVKTRLAETIGGAEAARVQLDMLRETVRLQLGRGFFDCIAGSPDEALERFRQAFPSARVIAQGGGDLGARMESVAARLLECRRAVIILGADSPDLPVEYVDEGLERLGQADAVLGPCIDGGFYLIGLKAVHAKLFEGVEWGGPGVLKQVLTNATALGLETALLPRWQDIDTIADLVEWQARLRLSGGFPAEPVAG